MWGIGLCRCWIGCSRGGALRQGIVQDVVSVCSINIYPHQPAEYVVFIAA